MKFCIFILICGFSTCLLIDPETPQVDPIQSNETVVDREERQIRHKQVANTVHDVAGSVGGFLASRLGGGGGQGGKIFIDYI